MPVIKIDEEIDEIFSRLTGRTGKRRIEVLNDAIDFYLKYKLKIGGDE